jgi:hypothetical protein
MLANRRATVQRKPVPAGELSSNPAPAADSDHAVAVNDGREVVRHRREEIQDLGDRPAGVNGFTVLHEMGEIQGCPWPIGRESVHKTTIGRSAIVHEDKLVTAL